MLNTDQTTTLMKTLTIFIENRDPFTIESIVNEIKRSGDMFDGFHDDKGECVVEDYWDDIADVIDNTIRYLYNEWEENVQTVYVFRPCKEDEYDDYDEIEDLEDWDDEDDINVDKEGNRLPDREEVYDDTKDDLVPGEYYNEDGEIEWDRDTAETDRMNDEYEDEEFHDLDHPIIYDLKVDKNKRINIKKAIFEEAKWKEDEEVIVIGNTEDNSQFYIARKKDLDSGEVSLINSEYIFGEYKLKNSSLRIGVSKLLSDVSVDDVVKAKIIWESGTNFNYINIGFDIE